MVMHYRVLLLFSWTVLSISADGGCPTSFRTVGVSLTDSSNPVNFDLWYTAANVTLHPTASTVIKLLRFIPALIWTNLTCNESINNSALLSRIPSFKETRMTDELIRGLSTSIDKLPDWSLWDDRSVLVVNLYPMEWPTDSDPCPSLSLCSILGVPSKDLLIDAGNPSDLCHRDLTEFSTGCRDSALFTSVYPILFSVSSALNIRVEELTPSISPVQHSPLNFVVSAGYRLPPGVFECPNGLFPCIRSNLTRKHYKILPSAMEWEQRICLPMALRCDGVPNCPGSDFDEQNCDDPLAAGKQTFDPIPHERDQVLSHLAAYDDQIVMWLSPTLAMAGLDTQKSSVLLYGLILGIPILCLVLLVAGWYAYQRVRRLRAYSTVMGATQNGHAEKDKNGYDELVDEVLGNGTVKTDLFDPDPNFSPPSPQRLHVEHV